MTQLFRGISPKKKATAATAASGSTSEEQEHQEQPHDPILDAPAVAGTPANAVKVN